MDQLQEMLKRFGLYVYEDNLLSPAANRWLTFMKVAILIMVSMEGAAWGYAAGWLLGDGDLDKWFWRVSIGLIIMVMFWIVDASFITLDIEGHQKNPKQSSPREDQNNTPPSTLAKIWQFLKWPGFPVGSRILLILVSLAITAPLVAAYELRHEIDHDLEARFLKAVGQTERTLQDAVNKPSQDAEKPGQLRIAEEELNKRYQVLIDAKRKYLELQTKEDEFKNREVERENEKRESLEKENLDKSAVELLKPKRFTTALDRARVDMKQAQKAYDEQNTVVANLRNTVTIDDTAARDTLGEFQRMVKEKDYLGLKDRFYIQEIPNSLTTRFGVLREWADKPEFIQVTQMTYAFLGVIAGVIFLGKYYQPDTVRVYFSEHWQARWDEFERGAYDSYIPEKYTDNRYGILPITFCALWKKHVEPKENNEELQKKEQEIRTHFNLHEPELARRKVLEEVIAQLKVDIDKKETSKRHLEKTISGFRAEIDKLRKRKGNVMTVSQFSDTEDPEITHRTLSEIENQINTINQSIDDTQNRTDDIEKEVATHRTNLSNFEEESDALDEQLKSFYQKLKALKKETTELAGKASPSNNQPVHGIPR